MKVTVELDCNINCDEAQGLCDRLMEEAGIKKAYIADKHCGVCNEKSCEHKEAMLTTDRITKFNEYIKKYNVQPEVRDRYLLIDYSPCKKNPEFIASYELCHNCHGSCSMINDPVIVCIYTKPEQPKKKSAVDRIIEAINNLKT